MPKKKTSDIDIAQYIKSNSDYCPFCKSPDVQESEMMHYDEETGKAYRPMECLTCFNDWTEVLGKENLVPVKIYDKE